MSRKPPTSTSAFKKNGGGDIEAQPINHGDGGKDESNPFESGSSSLPSLPSGAWAHPPSNEEGNTIIRESAGLTEEEIAMREANIRAREERLRQKEDQLDERARNIGANLYPNNWPCKCWAISYNDISNDIPDEQQAYVRRFYRALLFTYFVLIFNAITVLVNIGECGASFTSFLWAVIYCVCGFPIAWNFWYKPIYQMNRKSSGGIRWVIFFVTFGIHWLFMVFMIIGYSSGAGSGVFTIISDLADSCKASSLFSIIDTVLSGLLLLLSTYLMQAAWRSWRKGGGSVKGMKTDMTKAAAHAAASHALNSDV